MMKKLTIILSVCLWAVAIQAQNFGSEAMRKLQMAEFAISNFYVDKVDEDKLVEEAIIKMLAQLDPHSTYSDAEEVKKHKPDNNCHCASRTKDLPDNPESSESA